MINRTLIRLKVVQIVYAHYQSEGKSLDATEKELFSSLEKAYDLYHYLLLLMVELTELESLRVEVAEKRYVHLHEGDKPSRKFIDNRFIAQLKANKALSEFRSNLKDKSAWDAESGTVRLVLDLIEQSEIYKEYIESEESSYMEDRDFWKKIYKSIISYNDSIDESLENMCLYWNDDKEIVDTFIIKTIKKFQETDGPEQPLLPEYANDDDQDFARKLLRRTILNEEYYRQLLSDHSKNWKIERLAFMDTIIMQIALAEIMSFPNIPLSVSINEYVDLAKVYSTPKSGKYINGMLDAIAKDLIKENKLIK